MGRSGIFGAVSAFQPCQGALSAEQKEAVGATNAKEYAESWLEGFSTLGEICASTLAPNARAVDREKYGFAEGKARAPATKISIVSRRALPK